MVARNDLRFASAIGEGEAGQTVRKPAGRAFPGFPYRFGMQVSVTCIARASRVIVYERTNERQRPVLPAAVAGKASDYVLMLQP